MTRCATIFRMCAASTRRSAVMRDLLAYLVRRLLENGANSSFVSVAAGSAVPIEVLRRPQAGSCDSAHARHPIIPLP